MTSPLSLLTTKGTRTERRSPDAFSREWTPTHAQRGPQPARLTLKTGPSSRRKLKERELSGLSRAVQGPAVAGEVRARTKARATQARRAVGLGGGCRVDMGEPLEKGGVVVRQAIGGSMLRRREKGGNGARTGGCLPAVADYD